MSSSKSIALNIYKKYSFLKPIYLFYNIYIRNFKFLKNGSQFGEEKSLNKLLKNRNKGTYLDVGCFHPTKFNNTNMLYRSGWSGINIDLNPLTIDLFNFIRPRDINVCAALSNKNKKTKLFYHHDLSSQNTLNKNHVKWMEGNFRLKDLTTKIIKTQKLKDILNKFSIKKIDFINIDIEGNEYEVISSINLNKYKTKVICIEMLEYNKIQKNNKIKIIKHLKRKGFKKVNKIRENYIFKK
tara:strand:+ start:518 stop:1237 length:720 start_codon:yes stop_codon:yes gene_type:complete